MQRRRLLVLILLALALPRSAAHADVIWRKDGSKIEGTIVAEEEKRVQLSVRVGNSEGRIWIDRAAIDRIERGELPGAEYERRLAALDPADVAGHRALLEWADLQNLLDAVRDLRERLPEVERRSRVKNNPALWCRMCEARGQRPCPECRGTGEKLIPCVRCDAKGAVRCKACGNRREGGALKCRKCSGAGEVEQFDPAKATKKKVKCPDCGGSGTHTCPECGGKKEQSCPACTGKGGSGEPCGRCGGKPIETCPTCTGSGLQPVPLTPEELEREAAAARETTTKPAAEKKTPSAGAEVKP
ncbi:MAG: hypothetical protein L0Z55_02420 [Planctomycetes bacterium]|nr:hypothetical protein [Planctomycetota bacterium]